MSIMDILQMRRKDVMPAPEDALSGRGDRMPVTHAHTVLGNPLQGPFDPSLEVAMFGLGCFGAPSVLLESPRCSRLRSGTPQGLRLTHVSRGWLGQTGHNEVVLVVFDPAKVSFADLLRVFWESHDPTQGMRQGNDMGTQYRSGIYTYSAAQSEAAQASRDEYNERLSAAGYNAITTEIIDAPEFYYAEEYHQQYLDKNPAGYCGIGGTGVVCGIGTGVSA